MTVVGYGAQIQVLRRACDMARKELDVSCELIDLRTILPWDSDTVAKVTFIHTNLCDFGRYYKVSLASFPGLYPSFCHLQYEERGRGEPGYEAESTSKGLGARLCMMFLYMYTN